MTRTTALLGRISNLKNCVLQRRVTHYLLSDGAALLSFSLRCDIYSISLPRCLGALPR